MNERGFSLIEMMVALVILTVGVLGLAASARVVTQMTGSGGRYGSASSVAASRFEQLRAGECTDIANGSATTGRYAETWTVTTTGQLRVVILTITYNDGTSSRSTSYSTSVSCVPEAS